MNKYIFETIKNYIPELTDGSITHVYPFTVPEGIIVESAVTYNLLNSPQTFGKVTARYQLTCFSKTASKAQEIATKLQGLFAHKIFATVGDPLATNSGSVIGFPYDRESGYFMFAVDITINTQKELSNYLQ